MSEDLKFIYKEENWYISAFINRYKIQEEDKMAEIIGLIKEKVANLTEKDLQKISWNPPWIPKVIDMGKNMTISCEWETLMDNFPYYDENFNLEFDTLGYFHFTVEYYKDNPEMKKTIEPALIQQIPGIVLGLLDDYASHYANQYLYIDLESPIYVMASSDQTNQDEPIDWTKSNILKYKKVIGKWTEIYSGQWPDYSEKLYLERSKHNLSNRLSELHFIRRNSGFIYMRQPNYGMFFESYMRKFVIEPTAKVRSIVFALMAVNSSLDILFMRQQSEHFTDIELIGEKIRNLKYLRGMIQTQMSIIYDELDYNRRPHYTKVLEHLVREFNLNPMLKRIKEKFDLIYDSMQLLYQKKNEENQEQQERGMNFLQIVFGLGIAIDVFAMFAEMYQGIVNGNTGQIWFNAILGFSILGLLLYVVLYFWKIRVEQQKATVLETVDAVILNDNDEVCLIRRKYAPCAGQLALPGGFIEEGEDRNLALHREVDEETNLIVEIVNEIGIYDKRGRDPRGNIESHVYLCKATGNLDKMEADDDADDIGWFTLKSLKGIDLAFDHEKILRDAEKFISSGDE